MRLLLKSLYFNLWEIGRFVLAPANIKETITVVSNQAVKAVSIEEEKGCCALRRAHSLVIKLIPKLFVRHLTVGALKQYFGKRAYSDVVNFKHLIEVNQICIDVSKQERFVFFGVEKYRAAPNEWLNEAFPRGDQAIQFRKQ